MSLLVREDDLIALTVYYTVKVNKRGVRIVKVLEEKQAKTMLQDPLQMDGVKTLNAKFKPPTWSAQQKLFAESAVYNPATGQKETDWSIFSDLQLKTSLIDWDLADDDGRPYPVTHEFIDQLPASIANELLSIYRRSMSADENEGN